MLAFRHSFTLGKPLTDTDEGGQNLQLEVTASHPLGESLSRQP